MKELYNCHRIDDKHYQITKFDEDLNPVYSAQKNAPPRLASYVCSTSTCDCPAGHASSCRHRKMLPIFISNKRVDSDFFFIWDEHEWYKAPGISFENDEPLMPTEMHADPIEFPIVPPPGGEAQASASEAPSPQPPTYRRF